jgi:protocatechuate 4,5-dioxygenase beta chain
MGGAYATCAERLAALQPTSVIIVGCDHYILFGTHCLPRYVIGTGDVDGPIDRLPGLDRGAVRNHEALATHIVEHGDGHGVDWTVARSFTVDHSFSIPHQLVVKPAETLLGRELPSIPVYLACGVDPYISLKRSADLGRQLRAAVEAFDADERVVIIGSGGISHWVGTAGDGPGRRGLRPRDSRPRRQWRPASPVRLQRRRDPGPGRQRRDGNP